MVQLFKSYRGCEYLINEMLEDGWRVVHMNTVYADKKSNPHYNGYAGVVTHVIFEHDNPDMLNNRGEIINIK